MLNLWRGNNRPPGLNEERNYFYRTVRRADPRLDSAGKRFDANAEFFSTRRIAGSPGRTMKKFSLKVESVEKAP